MASHEIHFTDDAAIEFVHDDELAAALRPDAASESRRRASHVLPERWLQRQAFRLVRAIVSDESRAAAWTRGWSGRWLADLSPSGGPTLGPFDERSQAIGAEIDWLNENL